MTGWFAKFHAAVDFYSLNSLLSHRQKLSIAACCLCCLFILQQSLLINRNTTTASSSYTSLISINNSSGTSTVAIRNVEDDDDWLFANSSVIRSTSIDNGDIVDVDRLEIPLIKTPRSAFCDVSEQNQLPLAILIKSSAFEQLHRRDQRSTWIKEAEELRVPVVFGLADTPNDRALRRDVEQESRINQDILYANFTEHYNNVSLKTLSLLLWQQRYCSKANFVLVTDTDVFIFVSKLLNYLQSINRNHSFDSKLIIGHCWNDAPPVRDVSHKNYVAFDLWTDPLLPLYCSGTAYLISRSAVPSLLSHIPSRATVQRFGNLEDVYFTGVLRRTAGVEVIDNHAAFHVLGPANQRLGCGGQQVLSVHTMQTNHSQRIALWNALLHPDCSASSTNASDVLHFR